MKLVPRTDIVSSPTSTNSLPPMQVKRYKCSEPGCDRQFNRKYTLLEHLNAHKGEKPYVCPVQSCRKRFGSSGNFSRHKRLHGVIKPLECPVEGCFCAFPSDIKLSKHMQVHMGTPVHVCKIANCGKTFSTPSNLNRHMKLFHLTKDKLRSVPPPQLNTPLPVQNLQQLHADSSSRQQKPNQMDPFPSPRVINSTRMGFAPPTFSPRQVPQCYGRRQSDEFFVSNLEQVLLPRVPLPYRPLGKRTRDTRNVRIAPNVMSPVFDEMEYIFTDLEKHLPQNLHNDMAYFQRRAK